jgi:hypothetical protein
LVLWYLVYTLLFELFYFVVVYLDVVDPFLLWLQMLVSPLLEARYFFSVVRWMIVQSKNMKKKQRIKVEKAGETLLHFIAAVN